MTNNNPDQAVREVDPMLAVRRPEIPPADTDNDEQPNYRELKGSQPNHRGD